MSHNGRSKIVSFRCDREALEVLEWEAAQTGIPLRTRVRAWVEKHLGEAGEVPVAPTGDDDSDIGGQ